MTARDYQLINIRYSCPLLSRDQILSGKVPTAPTIASMMGALEVQEALKIIHGMPVAAGSAMVFNGVTNQFYRTVLPRRPDCLSHETYPEPTPADLGPDATVADLFTRARASIAGPMSMALDRDVVTRVACPTCGWSVDVRRPRTSVTTADATCPTCRQLARPEIVAEVAEDSPLIGLRLSELGIPPDDVVRVDGGSESAFFRVVGGADRWTLAPRPS